MKNLTETARKSILIVEDEEAMAGALRLACDRQGWQAEVCSSAQAARKALERRPHDLMILDIGLPDANGLDFYAEACARGDSPPTLIITAHGNLANAIQARRLGAADYLVKPFDLGDWTDRARQLMSPATSAIAASAPAPDMDEIGIMIGAAPAMQPVYRQIAHACATDVPVLIAGATGTGKTLCARIIHRNSGRRDGPFVNLHCSVFSDDLLESELFGHEKHAFTGAHQARAGHLERAGGGTLLLDEVADIPPALQAKLLRFVEEHTFTRIGGREDIRLDVRVIAATNKDLKEEVRAGRFREDLFYRLQVLEVEMPPLARRREDIPALSAYFMGQTAASGTCFIGPEAASWLARHDWPGNIRELRHVIERAVSMCADGRIEARHLPPELGGAASSGVAVEESELQGALERWVRSRLQPGTRYAELHDHLEKHLLACLLEMNDYKPGRLAASLDMNRATLLRKRRDYGLGEG